MHLPQQHSARWPTRRAVAPVSGARQALPAAAGPASRAAAAGAGPASRQLDTCAKHDLLLASTSAGTTEPLEVLEGWDAGSGSAVVGWKGQRLRLSASEAGLQWEQVGVYPDEGSGLATKFPAMKAKLPACHTHGGQPGFKPTSVEVAYSLAQLTEEAKSQATLWCEGTKPGAPEKSALQALTLPAGELVALLQGSRAIATVQLWNGWDAAQGQPLYCPFVLQLLEQALAQPELRACLSVAPGDVGLTAVLYVDREPWNKWGPHLASFGFQANAVAGSPYYKLLCGLILGYKEDNVRGYVQATSPAGSMTPVLLAQVASDLKRLSKAKPKLPWNAAPVSSRGKKAASRA